MAKLSKFAPLAKDIAFIAKKVVSVAGNESNNINTVLQLVGTYIALDCALTDSNLITYE